MSNFNVWNTSAVTSVFGETTLGISNNIMFPVSQFVSMVSGIMCVVNYLHNGMMKTSSKNRCCTVVIFLAKLMYVITSFWCKMISMWLLIIIITFGSFTLIISSTTVHGIWIFLAVVTIVFIIPNSFTILPMSRYLGLKNFILLYLKHPQLLTLPFITEFVLGPVDGYGDGRCLSCSYCCRCCCWWCCCKICRVEKGFKVSICKLTSWAKMIYSVALYVLYFSEAFWDTFPSAIFTYYLMLISVPIASLSFAIILHSQNRFGVVTMENCKDLQPKET